MATCRRLGPGIVWAASAMLCVLAGTAGAAMIDVNFDDGTTGALNAGVSVSSSGMPTIVTSDPNSPPVSGKALYAQYNYGANADRATIDTAQGFSNVVVSDVATLFGVGYAGGAGGVVAGMPAGGGAGYQLYVANQWNSGGGTFWDPATDSDYLGYQLVLVRKSAGTAYPLSAGNTFVTVKLPGLLHGLPNFLQLTVDGNTVTGQIWTGQTSSAGAPTASVILNDPAPLSGYVGTYLAGLNLQTPYAENWGVMSVDNFTASLIPEPATLAILAIGGVLALRRRK